jgi:hypothetical protein
MRAERSNPGDDLNFVPGGFCGHHANQGRQAWTITPDESAPIRRIRLGKRGWRDAFGNRYDLSDRPRKFYDYNF